MQIIKGTSTAFPFLKLKQASGWSVKDENYSNLFLTAPSGIISAATWARGTVHALAQLCAGGSDGCGTKLRCGNLSSQSRSELLLTRRKGRVLTCEGVGGRALKWKNNFAAQEKCALKIGYKND